MGITDNIVVLGTVEMILTGQDARIGINAGNVEEVLDAIRAVLFRHVKWVYEPVRLTINPDGSASLTAWLGSVNLNLTFPSPSQVKHGGEGYAYVVRQVRLMNDMPLISVVEALRGMLADEYSRGLLANLLDLALNTPK